MRCAEEEVLNRLEDDTTREAIEDTENGEAQALVRWDEKGTQEAIEAMDSVEVRALALQEDEVMRRLWELLLPRT